MKGLIISIIILLVCIIFLYVSRTFLYKLGVLRKLSLIEEGQLSILDAQGKLIKQINGNGFTPVTITIYDSTKFFESVATKGELGLGETYTNGVWECTNGSDIKQFMELLIRNVHVLQKTKKYGKSHTSKTKDGEQIAHHYDVGNDFYKTFLSDSLMAYTCAFWFTPNDTLDTAQKNKVDTIIRKLEIKKGDRILDIGCGWGHIGRYVMEKTGAIVDGVTISKEQASHINQNKLLSTVYAMHYDDMPQGLIYDKIYSIGMFEHIRCANYKTFFKKTFDMLKPGGRLVLHTIMINPNDLDEASKAICYNGESINFVTTHIFPGGQLPKYEWIINHATKQNKFHLVHSEGFGGQHYARTLKEWRKNLLSHKNEILNMGYSRDVIRAYDYYFAACEANFMLSGIYIGHFILDKVQSLYDSSNDFHKN